MFVVSVVACWYSIVATVSLALREDAYTHIFLIVPISAALIFLEWKTRKLQPQPNSNAGLPLLVLAILIGLIGNVWGRVGPTADAHLSLGILALVTWWIGAFVYCLGTRAFQICVFPLLFLLWLVPLPQFALAHIVSSLQQHSASAAQLLFQIAGVPVSQDGVVLSVPRLRLEVAKECSSIRSSMILLVTGMVLAHLLLRSAWGKILATLTLIIFAVAKNGFRIFTLAMLTVYVDPEYFHGQLHKDGGIVFLLLSVGCFFVVLWLIGWAERRTTSCQAVSN